MISTNVNQKKEPVSVITNIKNKMVYSSKVAIFLLLHFVYCMLYDLGILVRPPRIPHITISSLSDEYIERLKSRFLESYEKYDDVSMNMNIEKCFYDTKEHASAIEDVDNELEKTWRRRIMFENTPRGNIIMHYDAYKQGFAYYSDNTNIPYFVINAAIMKYVLLYKCRDFFIDNQFTPQDKQSVLNSVHSNQVLAMENNSLKNADSVSVKTPALKSSSFVKLKNYNTISAKVNPSSKLIVSDSEKQTNEKNYIRNKIIYSGKISNFDILQTPKIKKGSTIVFSSNLLDGLKENSDAQKNVFSYRDFKKMNMASNPH
jgi:hypothetical protein